MVVLLVSNQQSFVENMILHDRKAFGFFVTFV